MTDISETAVAARVKLLREDYAADGAGFDADMLTALRAALTKAETERDEARKEREALMPIFEGILADHRAAAIAQLDRITPVLAAQKAEIASLKAERDALRDHTQEQKP